MQSKQVPVTVAARVLYHLGEQLISDEFVALLELIKNAYDADATKCLVKVDTKADTAFGKGKITIEDNGNGMLPHTAERDFLRIATDYKKTNKISPYYKRRTLGEKGLGRLSYQRLGKYVEVITVPRVDRLKEYLEEEDKKLLYEDGCNCITVTMDWDSFADDEDIDAVYATVTEKKEDNVKYGTQIEILGIRNVNFWEMTQNKRSRIKEEILALINPFIEAKSNGAFSLVLDVDGEQFLVDTVEEKIINRLSDVSCHFSFDGKMLNITAEFREKYINELKERFIQKFQNEGFELVGDSFDVSGFLYKAFSVDLSIEEGWVKDCKLPTKSVSLISGEPAVDFAFDGSMYCVDMKEARRAEIEAEILLENKYIRSNFARIGELWKSIAGVFLYRDQFRILPYGKNDWLDFTAKSQKSKATILKQGNVSGYIQLNGEKSDSIREQTNRQGILEDEYGTNFLTIIKDIIVEKLFSWDIQLRSSFSTVTDKKQTDYVWNSDKTIQFQKKYSTEEIYKETSKKVDEAVTNLSVRPQQYSLYDEENFKKDIKNLEVSVAELRKATDSLVEERKQTIFLANEKISTYEEVIPLLGQSLIIEAVTHELSRIYSNLSHTTDILTKLIKEVEPQDKDLSRTIMELRMSIKELDAQLNHILPTQRYKLKDTKKINIMSFLQEQYLGAGAVPSRLKRESIDCLITGETFSVLASIGSLIIVFDNLIMNSEYWLDIDGIQDKKICFDCYAHNAVRIWDSGKGIAKEIENSLFVPFQTMKRDGRGLGLFIVQEILAMMNASISLIDERNNYGNRYIFEILF